MSWRCTRCSNPPLAGARDEDGDPLVFSLHPEARHLNEMIRLLVRHGVDLNARDRSGRTLLGCALAHGFQDFGSALRAHGATT
jgi:ankyrin repeat protein